MRDYAWINHRLLHVLSRLDRLDFYLLLHVLRCNIRWRVIVTLRQVKRSRAAELLFEPNLVLVEIVAKVVHCEACFIIVARI